MQQSLDCAFEPQHCWLAVAVQLDSRRRFRYRSRVSLWLEEQE